MIYIIKVQTRCCLLLLFQQFQLHHQLNHIIHIYSLLDDDLKNLEQQVINELEKLNEDFELEINQLD